VFFFIPNQALAYACKLLNKKCIVVMPTTSAQVKIAAVREYGAQTELVDVKQLSRQERVAQLAKENPDAYVASAYDDEYVIDVSSDRMGFTMGEQTRRE
jgi:threonine dehydratase